MSVPLVATYGTRTKLDKTVTYLAQDEELLSYELGTVKSVVGVDDSRKPSPSSQNGINVETIVHSTTPLTR